MQRDKPYRLDELYPNIKVDISEDLNLENLKIRLFFKLHNTPKLKDKQRAEKMGISCKQYCELKKRHVPELFKKKNKI